MRIVKEGAIIQDIPVVDENGFQTDQDIEGYLKSDTIEVNLDDFREWYYQVWFRKEGGSIHYKDVAKLMQEWLDSAIFMSTDLEAK